MVKVGRYSIEEGCLYRIKMESIVRDMLVPRSL